jgi:hypothetical protein
MQGSHAVESIVSLHTIIVNGALSKEYANRLCSIG